MPTRLALAIIAAASLGTALKAQPNRTPDGRPIPARPQSVTKYKWPASPTVLAKDTVTVARLTDGLCDWGTLMPRRRGLAAVLGERDDDRCWGVLYYSKTLLLPPKVRPETSTVRIIRKPAAEPKRFPPNLVDVDTITVQRLADGRCFWRNLPIRKAGPGVAAMLEEKDETTCRGVLYYTTHRHTAEDFKRMQGTDTTVFPRTSPPPVKKKP